jgi:hypothetical protein
VTCRADFCVFNKEILEQFIVYGYNNSVKKAVFGIIILAGLLTAAGYWATKNNISFNNKDQTPGVSPIVGNDQDEHGCKGSAGYSWCEQKNKCIRIWEEDCLSWQEIREALVVKDKLTSDTEVKITQENAQYATGTVGGKNGYGGGLFLAAKADGKWKIVYSGNGSVNCSSIKQNFEFPQEMLANFCD